jgi:hypothetical protein
MHGRSRPSPEAGFLFYFSGAPRSEFFFGKRLIFFIRVQYIWSKCSCFLLGRVASPCFPLAEDIGKFYASNILSLPDPTLLDTSKTSAASRVITL